MLETVRSQGSGWAPGPHCTRTLEVNEWDADFSQQRRYPRKRRAEEAMNATGRPRSPVLAEPAGVAIVVRLLLGVAERPR